MRKIKSVISLMELWKKKAAATAAALIAASLL